MLPSPTLAFIDSTVPYLYLPTEACKAFESTLDLVYDKQNNIYFVDDARHQRLLNARPQFTFRLANSQLSEPSIDITLPYASFDLLMKPPLQPNVTRYFPLRRGAINQITLGRVFLQEAYVIRSSLTVIILNELRRYVITDYDQRNFTIAQTLFDDTAKPIIVPIPWNASADHRSGKHISRTAIVGISTGLAASTLLAILLIVFSAYRRLNKRTKEPSIGTAVNSGQTSNGVDPYLSISIQEIGHQSVQELQTLEIQPELQGDQVLSGSRNVLMELPHSTVTLEIEPDVPGSRDIGADMLRDKSQKFECKRSVDRVAQNLNKALPSAPISRSHGNHNSSKIEPGTDSPQRFSHPTYCTIFDIEEYRDIVVVSSQPTVRGLPTRAKHPLVR